MGSVHDVPVERPLVEGEVVHAFTPARSDLIRARGQDLREGTVGLAAGQRLDAAGGGLFRRVRLEPGGPIGVIPLPPHLG